MGIGTIVMKNLSDEIEQRYGMDLSEFVRRRYHVMTDEAIRTDIEKRKETP